MFPWNPSPRKAEAGGYRVQLPGYIVRLSQNTKQKKHSSTEEQKEPQACHWTMGIRGWMSVESCKWRGRSEKCTERQGTSRKSE